MRPTRTTIYIYIRVGAIPTLTLQFDIGVAIRTLNLNIGGSNFKLTNYIYVMKQQSRNES